jgi:hypothetical protein
MSFIHLSPYPIVHNLSFPLSCRFYTSSLCSSFSCWEISLKTCHYIRITNTLNHAVFSTKSASPHFASVHTHFVQDFRSSQLWNITPCSAVKVSIRSGETCRFHLQGRKIVHTINQHKSGSYISYLFYAVLIVCLLCLLFDSVWFASLAYSSTIKLDSTFSSETSVQFHRTARRYVTEETGLYYYRYYILASCCTVLFNNFRR